MNFALYSAFSAIITCAIDAISIITITALACIAPFSVSAVGIQTAWCRFSCTLVYVCTQPDHNAHIIVRKVRVEMDPELQGLKNRFDALFSVVLAMHYKSTTIHTLRLC